MYGTTIPQLKKIISKGKIPVLHLGVKRCKMIMSLLPHSNSVFITLDNKDEMRKRLEERRSEDEITLQKRLKSYDDCYFEISQREFMAKHRIINNELKDSKNCIDKIIKELYPKQMAMKVF